MINSNQIKRQDFLENQKQQINNTIEDITRQMSFSLSDLPKYNDLDRQANEYFKMLEKVENELNLLKNRSQGYSFSGQDRQNTISKNLSKINFHKPKNIVNHILENCLGKQGGLSLFLLQNTSLMRGDLCVAEIQDRLSSNSYGRFKYCPIDPLLRPDISDKRSLLNAIADYFKPIESDLDEQRYARKIIEKIVDSVQGGSIVFFDFSNWDSITKNDYQLLSWFIEHFWKPLKEKHKEICKNYSWVKFILFISISSTVPESYNEISWFCDSIDTFCDNVNNFENLKIPELPLSNWEETDIDDWLQEVYGLSKSESEEIARSIYRVSNDGIPITVCSKLEQSLPQLIRA